MLCRATLELRQGFRAQDCMCSAGVKKGVEVQSSEL